LIHDDVVTDVEKAKTADPIVEYHRQGLQVIQCMSSPFLFSSRFMSMMETGNMRMITDAFKRERARLLYMRALQ